MLRNQADLVETINEEITIDYNTEIDEIKVEISELKHSLNILKPKVRNIEANQGFEKSTDESQREALVISKFKTKVGRLKQCLEDIRSIQLEFKARQDALDQWVLKSKAYLARDEEDKIDSDELMISDLDNSILEAFLKNTLYKIEDFGSKKKLEEMLGFYIDKVARREKAIQSCHCDAIDVKHIIDSTKKELTTINIPDQHYHTIKNELKQINLREKAIELLVEERRSQLEFEILKQGEENFQMYLESNADVFVNVKKTYGSKISEKMKNEQKQEFIDMIRDQYQKRYNEIKKTHFEILDIDKRLDDCDRLINIEIPDRKLKFEDDIQTISDRLVSMKQQLAAFVLAENECNEVVEDLLEKKKEEIYHQNNEIY